jgi:N-acetylmuramoyl-L-alanine amidase
MKCVLSIGWLLVSLLSAPAVNNSWRLPRLEILGTEYVRLDVWAEANGFQASWVVPRKELKLSHPSGSLQFIVDSRKMTFRGVDLWLSHAIAFKDGQPYVASLDLGTAIHPLLYPQRAAGRAGPVRHIVLDPGHGGRDPGNQEGRQKEKDLTLAFAKEIRVLLVKAGYKVTMTRDRDSFIELPARPQTANRRAADLFVSLHFNSADGPGGSSVSGAEVYCMTPVRASSTNARGEGAGAGAYSGNRYNTRNVQLAYQIQKALTDRAGLDDRGVKRARFAILRDAAMPAVLIEAAFMTNQGDAKKIYDPERRRALAQAIADGIGNYRKAMERP